MGKIIGWLAAVAMLFGAVGYYYFSSTQAPLPSLNGTITEHRLTIGNLQRRYLVYRPANLAVNAPLVMALHGSQGSSEIARQQYGYRLDALADQYGFLVAYPQGFENHWNDCRIAAPYAAHTQNIRDVEFLGQLKKTLVADYGLNPNQSYLTGMSNGGQMVIRMALEAPDTFAAYGVIIANMPAANNMGCRPEGKPVTIAFMNGTNDPLNPYNGGEVAFWGLFSKRGQVTSTADSIKYWLELAGIDNNQATESAIDNTDTADQSEISVSTWQSNQHRVRLYRVAGGGHTLPSTRYKMPNIAGGQNHDTNAADLLWDFFNRNQTAVTTSQGAIND